MIRVAKKGDCDVCLREREVGEGAGKERRRRGPGLKKFMVIWVYYAHIVAMAQQDIVC